MIAGGFDLLVMLICFLILLVIGLKYSDGVVPMAKPRATRSEARSREIDVTFIQSTKPKTANRPLTTIHTEYQRLLYPSARYYVNDKVFVNDKDLAKIVEADGLGNYRVQYVDNGKIDFLSGSTIRKALPMIT